MKTALICQLVDYLTSYLIYFSMQDYLKVIGTI